MDINIQETDKDLDELYEELESLLKDIVNKNDNEINYTFLKIMKLMIAQDKNKEQTEKELLEQQRMEQYIDSIIKGIEERPAYYFASEEENVQKMIDDKLGKDVLPEDSNDRYMLNLKSSSKIIDKMFDKLMKNAKDPHVKQTILNNKKQISSILNQKYSSKTDAQRIIGKEVKRILQITKEAIAKERQFSKKSAKKSTTNQIEIT